MSETNVTVKKQVEVLLQQLNEELFGKEDTMKIVLLAILAGESAFLLGEPGTAKSMVSRRISDAFEDVDTSLPENKGVVKYFEYLMNQFSTPDEVFGPVSLESLKKDEYKRITDRFLPKAKFAFLDEIWKASPAIQNALLTILNEKKFHNGSSAEKVPLMGFIAASNELPQKDAGLEAIFDRFLVRLLEKPIQKDSDFFDMITSSKKTQVVIQDKLSEETIAKWQSEADNITFPEECKELIRNIRKTLALKNKEENRYDDDKYLISDRRWKKIVGLLRMCAYINGRTEVNLSDCVIIPYCLWSTEIQEAEIFNIIADLIVETFNSTVVSTEDLESEFNKIKSECDTKLSANFQANLSKVNFPGGTADLIKIKKDILVEIEYNRLNPLLEKIYDAINKLESDFEKKTEFFNQNLIQSKILVTRFKKAKNETTKNLKDLSAKIEEYNQQKYTALSTNFIELDKRIKDTVTHVNKLYNEPKSVSNAEKLQTIKDSILPSITEQIEAERQAEDEIFLNQKDVFGEAVLSSSKFRTLLASTRGEITNSLSDNSKQVASIEKVITMILGQ